MCMYKDAAGHCALYSSATATSFCVEGPCPDELLTNADRIRAMDDEELAEFLACTWGASKAWKNAAGEVLYWLQQPAEEDYQCG